MSGQVAAWFTEKVKDQVTIQFQSHGGLLDHTMMSGDVQANTVKFPIAGRSIVYKLTGAIEDVPVSGPGLTTVQITMDDFESSEWWRTQDAYKAGPNEQATLTQLVVNAIRRERDLIKWRALTTFGAAGPGNGVITIGDGSGTIDLLHTERARAEIMGTGADESGAIEVYMGLPAMWDSQLSFYKEYANAEWVGLDNAPFSKTQRMRTKTVRGINYIVLPDEYFTEYETGKLETFMWHKNSMGAETPWNQEAPSISKHEDKQGSPYLVKVGLGGAAIGIQGAGVKRIRMAKIAAPTRPA